ncbi:cysteine desulfurase family protein [Amycolatopsis carbonis]|uniref:Cysteine desulfurase family protein n=1 Tax=Amycolatopsis carbonis TaxID=715471 RepID=A0A9Y2IDU6_9PSEU|nr:cysteine desulfurase family protein [Amycolatopsis sp. 2-15]WIX77674.1 cysteine desulfurase family protein [Amycolatopsis sp. 2-15]
MNQPAPVYLDYNATTPVDPRVVEAALPFWAEWFGNPSSDHAYAAVPRRALGEAREQVAEFVGARSDEVVFTASGSEANLLALRGAVAGSDAHLVVQATEHPSVLETARALARLHGTRVTVLPVDHNGLVEEASLEAAVRTPAAKTVVSVMAANNETGALQPIPELAAIAHEHGALVHCDAAQACAKIPVDVSRLGVDLLTIVGHKMYAPRGAAALYVRRGIELEPVVYGGGQERGLRAGTENVALAVALGTAARLAADVAAEGARVTGLRDSLHDRLAAALPGRVQVNGPVRRLPNTLNVSIDGVRGHELLAACPQLAASTGSACHSGVHSPSPVLAAMGVAPERALSAIRLSLGRFSGSGDVDVAVKALVRAA